MTVNPGKLTSLAMVMAGLVATAGCATVPQKPAPKEYEVSFELEINGRIVERQWVKVREVPLGK